MENESTMLSFGSRTKTVSPPLRQIAFPVLRQKRKLVAAVPEPVCSPAVALAPR